MSCERFNLDLQAAIMTGASAGLGFAMAEALAGAGSHVIITSRTLCRAEAAAERIRGRFPVAALALELDQRDPESVRRFAAQAEKWQGRMGRIGDDITGAVLFLASSASDHITGQNRVVDGGFSFYK
ncbi:MAG: SDR family oxidoreductase [Verrucomicrobia bacterium]|nr:SDR family oxidoreductase [Verrucomicrobiota bacterium]